MQILERAKQAGIAPLALVATLVLLAGGYFLASHLTGEEEGGPSAEGVKFEVVDAAHRELDGSPALALSFSLPLDPRSDYGKFVQVLEMPSANQSAPAAARNGDDEDVEEEDSPRLPGQQESQTSRSAKDTALEGGKPVAGAWVVGENPRLLFFPHINHGRPGEEAHGRVEQAREVGARGNAGRRRSEDRWEVPGRGEAAV